MKSTLFVLVGFCQHDTVTITWHEGFSTEKMSLEDLLSGTSAVRFLIMAGLRGPSSLGMAPTAVGRRSLVV